MLTKKFSMPSPASSKTAPGRNELMLISLTKHSPTLSGSEIASPKSLPGSSV